MAAIVPEPGPASSSRARLQLCAAGLTIRSWQTSLRRCSKGYSSWRVSSPKFAAAASRPGEVQVPGEPVAKAYDGGLHRQEPVRTGLPHLRTEDGHQDPTLRALLLHAREDEDHQRPQASPRGPTTQDFQSMLELVGSKAAARFTSLQQCFRMLDADHNGRAVSPETAFACVYDASETFIVYVGPNELEYIAPRTRSLLNPRASQAELRSETTSDLSKLSDLNTMEAAMDGAAESPVASSFRDARAELQNALSELQTDLARVLEEKVSDFQMLLAELPSELPAGIPIIPAPVPQRDMTKELMEAGPAVEKAVRIEGMELHSGTSAPRSSARSTRASGMKTLEQELFVSKKAATNSQRNFRREKSYVGYVQKGSFLGLLVDSVGCRSFFEGALGKVDQMRALQEPPRSGCCAKLVRSSAFQFVTTTVIMANCLTLLISANWAMENQSFDIPQELRYLDLGFTIFYVLELLLKFYVHRLFFFWREDWKWNVFDFVLVAMAVQEQVVEFLIQHEAGTVTRLSYMRSLRVARVSRILRLLRAIRVIRELRMMVFSIISSFTALFWCLVLISLVICVFALFFLQICTDYLIVERDSIADDVYTDFQRTFGSLTKTMTTLYLATTGGFDWERALSLLNRVGVVGSWAWLFYIAFFNFALFNVLTGMFVDHAMKWSQSDNQNLITEHRSQELQDAARLQRLCEAIDTESTGRISWEDFECFVSDESALIYLASIGLEIHDAKTFFDMLAGVASDKYIDIETFVKGCMRMKGPATSIDMLSMAYEVTLMHRQSSRIERSLAEVQTFQRKVERLLKEQPARGQHQVFTDVF
eukprot:s497_g3.t1